MSRQSDVMSDLESMDKMLWNYYRNELDCQSGEKKTKGDIESNDLQADNPTKDDFRFLIKTKRQENSEITIATEKMINYEITSRVTRKLDEIRDDLIIQGLKLSTHQLQ